MSGLPLRTRHVATPVSSLFRTFVRPNTPSRIACATALLMAFASADAQQKLTPTLPNLTGIVNTTSTGGKTGLQWAIVLGKALFWDQQSGSDGVACASCHYNAGADIRLTNQLSPGARDVTVGPNGDTQF